MFARSEDEHYTDVWTLTSTTGENTRVFIGVAHNQSDNTYTGFVSSKDYPDNNGATFHFTKAQDGEIYIEENQHTSVEPPATSPWDKFFDPAFNMGSDSVYTISTDIPIFDTNPNDPEKVDAIKRYIESGDISGAENYADLVSPEIYIDCWLQNETNPVCVIKSRITETEASQAAGISAENYTVTYTTGDMGLKNPRTFTPGGGAQLQFFSEVNIPLTSRSYILMFNVNGTLPNGSTVENQIVRGQVTKKTTDSRVTAASSANGKVHLTFHFDIDGDNKDDNSGDDANDHNPTSPTIPGDGNVNTLTTTYKLTLSQLKSLGNYLWSASFTDDINLVNESPIQNVLSCKMVPVSIGGDSETVKIVNVNTGVSAIKCNAQCVKIERAGLKTFIPPKELKGLPYDKMGLYGANGISPTWLDYENTSMSLYLPFIGHKTINPRQFMGKGIRVDYTYDVISGQCEALVYYVVGNSIVLVHRFGGSAGVNICLSARDTSEYILGQTSNALSGFGNLLAGNFGGAAQNLIGSIGRHYKQESTGLPNALCSTLAPTNIYLIIERPRAFVPNNFGHTHGFNCCYNQTIKNLKGYTEIKEIDLSNINCFESERSAIKNILASGFYA